MKNLLKGKSKYERAKAISVIAYFVFLFSILIIDINIIN
jgi:hypothetical protein